MQSPGIGYHSSQTIGNLLLHRSQSLGRTSSLASTEASFSNGVIWPLETFRSARAASSWNSEFDAQFPSWLIGDDFDIGMLEIPIAARIAELAPSCVNTPRGSSTGLKVPLIHLLEGYFAKLASFGNC
jgi:hypothetical protein